MTNTLIKLRRSAVPGKVPTDAQLELGEVAINTYDGKMFFKQQVGSTNNVLQIATTSLNLGSFAATTSAQLASVISNETGSGSLVFGTSPTLVSPTISGNTSFDGGILFIDSLNNRVGINTSTPSQALQVTGNVRITGTYVDSNGNAGTPGQILTSNGTGTYWSSVGSTVTNLSYSATGTTVTIASDTGTDATILTANTTVAGVVTNGTQYFSGVKSFTSNTIFNTNTLFIDAVNDRVGIGSSTPLYKFFVQDDQNNIFGLREASNTDGPVLITSRARGNLDAPSQVQAGDSLGGFRMFGYDGTYYNGPSVSIDGRASELFTTTARGAYITFETTENGTTGKQERLRIGHDGNVGIGSIAPFEKLHVEGNVRALSFMSANGSVTSPSYDFTSDPNTGMFLAGADTIGFATNGTTAAQFTSTGNLRLFNTSGNRYTEISNQPTANNTLTLPNTGNITLVSGTMVPTTGTGATGTWPISVTGSASTPIFSADMATRDGINTRVDSGFYQTANGTIAEGWPVDSNSYQYLINVAHSNKSNYFAMQFASSMYNQTLYFRNTNSGTTSTNTAWSEILHSNNYTSYTPTLTGAGATGTWPISITGNAASVTNGVYTTNNQVIGGDKTFSGTTTIANARYRYWTSADTDIDGLLPGTAAGAIIESPHNGHMVIGIRDNDTNDSFTVVSGGGDYSATANTYDTVVASFRADGNVGIGTPSPSYKLHVIGTVAATDFDSLSDRNLKENIVKIDNALDKVNAINGVYFNFKNNPEKRYAGVIAQEVQTVLPEAVSQASDGTLSVSYGNIVGLLIEAMKEQQRQIDELKSIVTNK